MTGEVIPIHTVRGKSAAETFEFTKTRLNAFLADGQGSGLARDTITRGLVCRRGKRGAVLAVERRIDGKLHRVTLTEYGPSTSLKDLRGEAEDLMAALRAGTHVPRKTKAKQARKTVQAKGMTLGEAFALHREANPQVWDSTIVTYAYGLMRFAGIDTADRDARGKADPVATAKGIRVSIADIDGTKVRSAYDRVLDETSAGTAASMLRSLRAIWNTWADETEHDGRNPVERLTKKRNRVARAQPRTGAIPPAERRGWYDALERLTKTSASFNTARALQFLFLTGMRRDEVLGLSWAEIDGDSLTVPGERMKSGQLLTRPITREMQRILTEQRKMNPNSQWVFPASRGGGRLTDTRKTLRKLTPIVMNHDLRRGYIVAGALANVPEVAVKLLVGHSISDITETYATAIRSELPELAQRIEDELMREVAQ